MMNNVLYRLLGAVVDGIKGMKKPVYTHLENRIKAVVDEHQRCILPAEVIAVSEILADYYGTVYDLVFDSSISAIAEYRPGTQQIAMNLALMTHAWIETAQHAPSIWAGHVQRVAVFSKASFIATTLMHENGHIKTPNIGLLAVQNMVLRQTVAMFPTPNNYKKAAASTLDLENKAARYGRIPGVFEKDFVYFTAMNDEGYQSMLAEAKSLLGI